MAHTLDITDSTTTVNLATGGGDLLHYTPMTPKMRTSSGAGGKQTSTRQESITESATVYFSDASRDVVRGYVNSIEKLFDQAAVYQEWKTGSRVYVNFQPSGDSDTYRSEILSGRVAWGASALGYEWANAGFEVSITWTRRWYWEGPETVVTCTNKGSESTVSVTASTISFTASTNTIADSASGLSGFAAGDYIAVRGSTSNDGPYLISSVAGAPANIVVDGSNTPVHADEVAGASVTVTKAITVYNHSDGGASHGNYVDVADGNITTVIESPVRMEIINTYNSAQRAHNIVVCKAAVMGPSSFSHILEGEDGTGGSTVSGSSSYSNSAYQSLTISGDTEQTLLTWTLSSSLLNTASGYYFHGVLRYGGVSVPTGTKLRLKVMMSVSTLWQGEQVTVSSSDQITHLGSFRLPPNLYNASGSHSLSLVLTGQKTGGGTVNVDYLQLTPTESYRKYINAGGYDLDYNERLVDDVFTGNIFSDWVASGSIGQIGLYIADGAQLTLIDGYTNRFYFVHDGDTGMGSALRTLAIVLRYRPRRLTL